MSLSLGPNTVPRVCCHQSGTLKNTSAKNFSEAVSLKHNEAIKQKMLNNEIPSECQECHLIEKEGCTSPRMQYLEKFSNPSLEKLKIEYLDITIDNRCNLECIMCSPSYSHRLNSFFNKDLKTKATEKWELGFSNEEIRSLLPDLKMLTLTGGEPLLSKRAMDLLVFIAHSEHAAHIELRLFSNLTFLPENLKDILNQFKEVEFIFSIDSIEENYEFIRYPAKWSTVHSNIQNIQNLGLANTNFNVHTIIMATNWNKLTELIRFYQTQKINAHSLLPIFVEIENPSYLHPSVLPSEDFNQGLDAIVKLVSELRPKNSYQEKQLEDFSNLLKKIKERDFKNQFIDHTIYMNKIQNYRKDNNPHVL